jgi:high-affinity nickel-transport protein
MGLVPLLLLNSALLFGLRHGVDWDHIAAITDISGSSEDSSRGFLNATSYILGHALVIIILGVLIVLLGIKLPDYIDAIMEPVVGITLIALGLWLLYSVIFRKDEFKLISKWMLLFKGLKKLGNLFHKNIIHTHPKENNEVGLKTAFLIGVAHGIGAETPTQVLLFITAAGTGGIGLGLLMVLTFVLGLIISNTIITLLALKGYRSANKNPKILLTIGAINGIFSLILGILLLTGNASILPELTWN